MIVQTDDGWLAFPKEYKPSDKLVKIDQREPNRNFVEFDTGFGRFSVEPFFWAR